KRPCLYTPPSVSPPFSLQMLTARDLRCNCDIRTRPWTSTEYTDWWEREVMNEFQPSDWLEKFRMSQETFFLCGKLKPRLARQDTHFRRALPLEKRVAVALWRLASNIEYRTISGLFGVASSTVCKCVRDVCHAIVTLLRPVYLCSPSIQEMEDCASLPVSLGLPSLRGRRGNPPHRHPHVAVNGLGQFWDVCAGFPSSSEPTAILQNSALWASRFVWAWRIVAVALLRLRARCLVPTMILACCILHNVCEVHEDLFRGEWHGEVTKGENPQPGHTAAHAPSPPGTSDHLQGEEVRKLFCDYFQQPQLQQQD
uniref:DDE Tnp4 domain-containing protein n=1 Tax=Salmo trutta TaxID=8032 RepID=A0A674D0H5_SALTR